MKFLFVLPLLITTILAQGFGGASDGLAGFGNVARGFANIAGGLADGAAQAFSNVAQGTVNSVANFLPKVSELANVKKFDDFLEQTGQAISEADRTFREGIFAATKNLVDAGNQAFVNGIFTFHMAVNAFADLTREEFIKKYTGRIRSSESDAHTAVSNKKVDFLDDSPAPDSFDWREKGGVSAVKNQLTCGACWAFATTGAIEGHTFAATGTLPDLSEQNLIDCGPREDFGLNGCKGGFQEAALCWISENQKGVSQAESYPYVNSKESCKFQPNELGAHVSGFGVVPPGDEEVLKRVVATLGPVACSVSVSNSLQFYGSGIFNDEKCNELDLAHSILVVGYGSENGKDYWIVKNSWDTTWGEKGYFRIRRGKNLCKIADECSYPVVKNS
ncbi:procathepsin L-like [Drosophila eugracilis]|uniref:procathepsin L-like n=1 Tax=Drosophila eugracilis TaxID=29029 RepID=UPI001BDB5397|nr:procathepsin L-like [Drosophila eugracilis]